MTPMQEKLGLQIENPRRLKLIGRIGTVAVALSALCIAVIAFAINDPFVGLLYLVACPIASAKYYNYVHTLAATP